MKESLKEYLTELKEREVVDAKLLKEKFELWLESARASAEAEDADDKSKEAFTKI